MKVLVTDADDRKALASVRNLGRKGLYVIAAGPKRWEQSFFSKYARERLIYPNPAKNADEFARFLLDYLGKEKIDCVLPMSDYTTIPLSRHKGDFEKVTHLAVPDWEVLSLVRDKAKIIKIAAGLGIAAPETHCPATVEEAREVAARMSYPCVVKYKKGTGAIGIRYAKTREQLMEFYGAPTREADVVFDDLVPMMQEYIPGGIHDVCVLFARGEPRAVEIHERTKMYPPTGGYGAAYRTELAPDMRETAIRLLSHVGWHGPALVEFKRDARDGRAKLMEVNTRFWGGVDVSAHAGIDFVHLAYKLATEGDVEPEWDYEVGMKYRWLFPTEFASALESENRLDALLEFFTFERGTKYDIVPSDPLPHLVKAGLAVYRGARRLAKLRDKNSGQPCAEGVRTRVGHRPDLH